MNIMKNFRIFRALVLPILSALLLAAPLARAKTIPNPSFEANTFTVPPGYASGNGGSISGWAFVAGVGLNPAAGSPFADNGATPNGTNVAFIQSGGNGVASLSTTITGLTPGVNYQVSFRANSRAATAAANASWSLNGGAFAPFTAGPAVGAGNPYYTVTSAFTATSNTAPLVVRNQTAADSALLVDDFRIVEPGDLDTLNVNIPAGTVYATAVQPDGKIIVVGKGLLNFGGQPRYCIARLNTNGTVDTGFNPIANTSNHEIHCVAVQPDGKILIGGTFSANFLPSFLARLNADGSVDATFLPFGNAPTVVMNPVTCMAVQADGRILIGGIFTTITTSPCGGLIVRNHIARLNADGTLDMSFDPNASTGALDTVNSVAVQTDGRILIGGRFSSVGGIARNHIARVEADGTLDTSFNPNAGNVVNSVAVQADGRILLGGNFTSVGGTARNRIARLNSDGTLDTGFDPNAGNVVNSLAVQADGRILLGGTFTTLQPNGAGAATTRNRIARVNANGTLDTGFDPNANNTVFSVGLQADGMVLLGGDFTTLQPNGAGATTARTRFARLVNDAATQTLSALDTAHILWIRGGSAPELSRATFEVSTDGGTTWGAPIVATRNGTTANWQRSGGISLPASGQLRARGVTMGAGKFNSSSTLIEQVVSFSGLLNAPEIVVTGNGVNIGDGDSTPGTTDHTDFAAAAFGATTVVRTFTITNTGTAVLNLTGTPKVVVSDTHAADFAVTLQPASPVAANNGTTTIQVTFTPGAVGVRNATLSIANNDADEALFDFAITGRGLSFTNDTDGDGLNDAAELMGAALGFNWQLSQPALVQTYNGMANGAGLYTTAQVQALNVGTPLISRDVTTGKFKLTLGLTKTTTLSPTNWLPFPFIAAGTSINGQGNLEFEFTAPDNAAFFRIEAD